MKNSTQNVIQWLIISSADPSRYSATIKGLAMFIPSVLIFTQLLGWSVDEGSLLAIVDALASVASASLALFGAVYGAFGLVRKVYLSIK